MLKSESHKGANFYLIVLGALLIECALTKLIRLLKKINVKIQIKLIGTFDIKETNENKT